MLSLEKQETYEVFAIFIIYSDLHFNYQPDLFAIWIINLLGFGV